MVGIDQVAAQRPQPRQNAILVGSGKPANSRRRRTPRSPRAFAFRPRRYAAATVSAVSGRPGKASGGHRKDARGMSIIGLSMAALPCCTGGRGSRECSPCVSTGRSIHAVPSITPSPREGIEDGPRRLRRKGDTGRERRANAFMAAHMAASEVVVGELPRCAAAGASEPSTGVPVRRDPKAHHPATGSLPLRRGPAR